MALIPALSSRGREISEFEACLICRMSSLYGMRNPLLKKRKEGKKKGERHIFQYSAGDRLKINRCELNFMKILSLRKPQ